MNDISEAARILKSGGLVAFPTETVYGLGADATNESAVRRIFAAKGRPSTNPIIVHVPDEAVARRYAAEWPEAAHRLAERFWPGPLTLVVPRTEQIVPAVSAGLKTVGLRAPDHPLTLKLLRQFDGPVAAPSANRSTRVSPTTAQHVRDELGNAVDLVLDGGPCTVGIESTVLDVSTARPMILRPGGISKEQIEEVIGPVSLFHGSVSSSKAAASPGQQSVHYAPRAVAWRFEADERPQAFQWCARHWRASWVALCVGECHKAFADFAKSIQPPLDDEAAILHCFIEMPANPREYARRIYSTFRQLDNQRIGTILVEMPPDTSAWLAVRDRLRRATRPLEP